MNGPEQQTFSFGRVEKRVERRHNVVIEAGAGTGKTTAIVAEVLKLLLGEEDVAPERIVLVTFTEKAAGEIADRIQNALTEIRAQLDGDPIRWPAGSDHPLFEVQSAQRDVCRRAVERQLARIDGLRSQTIHAFCQTLLRQYPIEAGIDPQFQIIEGFDRSLLYGQLYDDWIDDETRVRANPNAAREWEALLEHCTYLFQARNYIFALVDKRHLLFDTRYGIGTIAEYEHTLVDAVQTIRARGKDASRITKYLRGTSPPASGSSLDDWIDYFAPIATDLRKVYLNDFDGCKEALKVVRGERTGSCVYDLLISHRAATALLSLTRRFIDHLDEEKRKRGVLDFDDLLIRTRRLLDEPAILERIRQQFDFIFVDEFQDTDRLQAEILKLLATDRSGNYVPGKLIIVGDPKQSIYAFRRADPQTYGAFTKSLLECGAAPRLLIDQYRSTPALVEALNAIGVPLFAGGDTDPNVFQPEYHALRSAGRWPAVTPPARRPADQPARPPALRGGLPLTFIGGDADPELEAEAIVAWIRARKETDLRRFALLFRRRTRMDIYLDVFDRHQLPYVLPPMGLFLDRPAPVDLLAVLRAIAYGYDRGALISAARTPYFALADTEIAAGVLNDEAGPWKAFIESLDAFRNASPQLTVTELIDHVVTTTGIEAVYRATRESTRSLRHLEQVRAIAFMYDEKVGGSVRQFVEEIARRREVPEEVEPSLLDDASNAVRILTIHGAKGLEFETVILPDIEFQSGSSGLDFFTVEEPPSLILWNGVETLAGICRFSENGPLKDIASLRDKAERRRLFYVAITRARSEVAIVCNPAKITNHGFGRYVSEVFAVTGSEFPAEPGRIVRSLTIGGKAIPVAFEKLALPEHGRTDAERLVDPALQAELTSGALVPCVVPQPEEVTPALPRAEVAIARRAAANRGAGILLHRILERWDGVSDVAPLLATLAVEQAADERSIDLVRQRLARVKDSKVFRRVVESETIGREMPIAFIDDSGALVEKRIDRLIRENGADTVIDYKSGEPTEMRLLHDREQVALYCRAVAQMTSRPCHGLLWYIDAEKDVAVDVM